jgi:hypothetical protein
MCVCVCVCVCVGACVRLYPPTHPRTCTRHRPRKGLGFALHGPGGKRGRHALTTALGLTLTRPGPFETCASHSQSSKWFFNSQVNNQPELGLLCIAPNCHVVHRGFQPTNHLRVLSFYYKVTKSLCSSNFQQQNQNQFKQPSQHNLIKRQRHEDGHILR